MSETRVGRITHLGLIEGLSMVDARWARATKKNPGRLTPEERGTVARAKVAASSEVDDLVRIIERLSGEVVVPADENLHPGKTEECQATDRALPRKP